MRAGVGMAERSRAQGRSPSALRVAVTAALIEEPAHGYALTNRINRRMGPLLQADPRRVYETLLDLEREGLATSAEQEASSGSGRTRRVFTATERAVRTHEGWLAERRSVKLAHQNIHALVAFSTPEQAQQVLRLLEEYELDCMELQEQWMKAELHGGSWRTRMIACARAGLTEQLHAEIRWVAATRREIEEYLAGSR